MVVLSAFGAGNEARTRDLNLGKVALYQLSYSRILSFKLYIGQMHISDQGHQKNSLDGKKSACQNLNNPDSENKKGKLGFPFRRKDVGTSFHVWSGKRGSNSRPQPWQGCALPTELFPHFRELGIVCFVRCIGVNCSASFGAF
jgi:hypothetical protein